METEAQAKLRLTLTDYEREELESFGNEVQGEAPQSMVAMTPYYHPNSYLKPKLV